MSKIKEISYTVQLDEKKRLMVKALIDTLYDGVDNSSLLADEETVKRTNQMLDMMVDKKVETGKISLRSFCQQMLQNFIKDNADKGVLQNIVNACKYLFDKLQGDVDKDKVMLENVDELIGVLTSIKKDILDDIFMKEPIMMELIRGSATGDAILLAMDKVGLTEEKHRECLEILARQRLEDAADAEKKAAAREAAAKAKAEADVAVAMQAAEDKAAALEAKNAKNEKFINHMKLLFASDGEN